MARLSKAGFKSAVVEAAILPDWWDDSCSADASLLTDIELRVARFLGASVDVVRSPGLPLGAPPFAGARLRRVGDIGIERLGPAIHVALQVARAAVRNRRSPPSEIELPPADPLAWREILRPGGRAASVRTIAEDLWARGIPVVPLETLPAPSFQALACIVDGCPVVVLGQKYDEPGRSAFIVAHEVGHLIAGDCSEGTPVVDEADEEQAVVTGTEPDMERRADSYAAAVLRGAIEGREIQLPATAHPKQIATYAVTVEREHGVDASLLVHGWARRTGKYAAGRKALEAMYRANGARETLAELFERHVDVEGAAESDRLILRCVHRAAARDEAAS